MFLKLILMFTPNKLQDKKIRLIFFSQIVKIIRRALVDSER